MSGTTYAQRTSGGGGAANMTERVRRKLGSAKRIVLVDTGFQNDLLTLTAAQCLTAAQTYWQTLKDWHAIAMGPYDRQFFVICATVIPYASVWGYTSAIDAQRLALNDLLRETEGDGLLTKLVDIDAMQAWNPLNTAMLADGIHPADTPTGIDLYVHGYADAIAALPHP